MASPLLRIPVPPPVASVAAQSRCPATRRRRRFVP